ncbi:hypothetical protein [Zooshikella sp. RANM57]
MADQYNTEAADIQEATPIAFKPLPYSYAKRRGSSFDIKVTLCPMCDF